MRVLSLIASSTEIIYALDCGDMLVGRSHECDYPSEVKELPFCTEPRFNVEGTSSEIDKRVKSILQQALSVYRIDEKKLLEIQPDLIITQSQCAVCAVSIHDVEKSVSNLTGIKPKIISLQPNKLEDILKDIGTVAVSLEVDKKGHDLVSFLKDKFDIISHSTNHLVKKSIACIEWIEPMMAAGNWIPELVEMAGGTNLFGKKGEHSSLMNLEDLSKKDPDKIIVMPCGYDINKTRIEMKTLENNPSWIRLRAVANNQVFLTDGNQYFNRPGPRLSESLEILAEIIHEEDFNFGHKGSGWEVY